MAADKYRPHNPLELARLLEWARGAKSILEIGSRYGYTLVDMARASTNKGRVVSVDLPGYGPWGESGSERTLLSNIDILKGEGFDAKVFFADSKSQKVIKAVWELGPFDFIFIDGDHTYEGVSKDWHSYGPIGKRIVFHDIVKPKIGERQELGVWELWDEIKRENKYETHEFIAPDSKMGIGRVGS